MYSLKKEIMNTFLQNGIRIVNQKVRPCFESAWKQVLDTETEPDYTVLIWGSTVQDKQRDPNDLDIIIEYTGVTISPDKESSIESMIQSRTTTEMFEYVDTIVQHKSETEQKISNSRVSEVYAVDECDWRKYS